jgi:hypothetical protein
MRRAGFVLSIVLLVPAATSYAQDVPPPDAAAGGDHAPDADLGDHAAATGHVPPWTRGVSAERQQEARALFREGNRFFERSQYPEALEHYRKAAALWDHPAVHFNIAVCLINLDQPVEAYAHLRQSMRHGADGLGKHFQAQAVTYQKLLVGRLARLRVGCRQADAEVTLDGKRLVACPGEATVHLLPGEHQLVAKKPGFLPVARSLVLAAGAETVETVELVPLARRTERRWKTWVPWTIVGAGVGAAAAGLGVRALAVANAEQFDREVARLCPQGCAEEDLPESVRDVRARADLENGIAVTLFVAATATIGTGVVMAIMNTPREVQPEPPPIVTPVVTRDTVGVAVQARF